MKFPAITLILLLLGYFGCMNQGVREDNVGGFKGKTVEETLIELGLNLNDASLVDEPPGKLRILEFSKKDKPTIELVLDYQPDKLFSIERDWDEEKILQAIVLEVKQGK